MRIARWVLVVLSLSVSPAGADKPSGAPPDTFVAAEAYAGPAATIQAACAEEGVKCKAKKLKKKPKPVAPYVDLGLIGRKGEGTFEEYLGIQTDKGWYLFELFSWGTGYGGRGSLKLTSVEIRDVVPGGSPEVLVTGKRVTSSESSSYGRHGDKEELLWVCGVGPSGAPSCAEILLAIDHTPNDMEDLDTAYKFRLRHEFTADGKLTRTVVGKWPAKASDMSGPIARGDYENTRGFVFP